MLAPLFASAGVFLIAAVSSPVAAQTTVSPLVGTWTLSEADEIKADGTRTRIYGADARGLLLIDTQGRYSLQIFRQGRLRFEGGDKSRGSPEAFRDSVMGMSTHFGRVEMEPAASTLVFHIDQAAFPNWEGTIQRRRYALTGRTLSYEVPPGPDGTVARSVWRRLD